MAILFHPPLLFSFLSEWKVYMSISKARPLFCIALPYESMSWRPMNQNVAYTIQSLMQINFLFLMSIFLGLSILQNPYVYGPNAQLHNPQLVIWPSFLLHGQLSLIVPPPLTPFFLYYISWFIFGQLRHLFFSFAIPVKAVLWYYVIFCLSLSSFRFFSLFSSLSSFFGWCVCLLAYLFTTSPTHSPMGPVWTNWHYDIVDWRVTV